MPLFQHLLASICLHRRPHLLFFFFLMIRRPPRSTLFPTRRSSDLKRIDLLRAAPRHDGPLSAAHGLARNQLAGVRSEEHTSELQSQSNIVCRLLLEKKKERPPFIYSSRGRASSR